MEPEKAQEILTDSLKGQWPTPNTDLNEAIKLGIQALIFAQNVLKLMPIVFSLPLPSEAKD